MVISYTFCNLQSTSKFFSFETRPTYNNFNGCDFSELALTSIKSFETPRVHTMVFLKPRTSSSSFIDFDGTKTALECL